MSGSGQARDGLSFLFSSDLQETDQILPVEAQDKIVGGGVIIGVCWTLTNSGVERLSYPEGVMESDEVIDPSICARGWDTRGAIQEPEKQIHGSRGRVCELLIQFCRLAANELLFKVEPGICIGPVDLDLEGNTRAIRSS